MATPQTIFSDASFPSVAQDGYLVPRIGNARAPAAPAGTALPVDLAMSDGTTVRVFASLRVALRCLEAMRQRKQAFLTASDDVFVYAISSTKLLVAEATLTNQRLLTSFSPSYVSAGATVFTHRSLSSVVGLAEALQSVGFAVSGPLQTNVDLREANANLQIVDYNWAGSRLDDGANAIYYTFDAPLAASS